MADEIINRVADSGIEQIDLKDFTFKGNLMEIDLKDLLWNEMVLREKEFRGWVKDHDWNSYSDQTVCLYCSSDAIVPAWAYMLISSKLEAAAAIYYGNPDEAREQFFFEKLSAWEVQDLTDMRVMVKGCSDIPNPNRAYVELTKKLQRVVKSLMFGEPCSAVPVYKKKN